MKMNRISQWVMTLLGVSVLLLAAYSVSLSTRLQALENVSRDPRAPATENAAVCPHITCAVSMAQLLSFPERYDGKRIRLGGLYCAGFELSALFPSWSTGILMREESIWVDNPRASIEPSKDECKKVEMSGVFSAGPKGHLNQHIGELKDVSTTVANR